MSSTDLATRPAGAEAAPAQPCIDLARVECLFTELLVAFGEDPTREGLVGTPRRAAASWASFLSPAPADAACFPEPRLMGQMVLVDGVSVWSKCEHHLLPMHLTVAAAYLPGEEVLGLSKFGRIAQYYAGRLQVQERFTGQVADHLAQAVNSPDIAVHVEGQHLCMSMRGVRMEDARTTTLQARGRFEKDPVLSQQFLAIATRHRAA
ncbi:GTP cyclohydrolase I [Kitasatospora sp. NPDC056783]|uniref:GTP cyclohydrolase I n=1 Tax=Kitasatospora sp. NPDC056783 TaxID=3345943 RepID=UPI0036BE746B